MNERLSDEMALLLDEGQLSEISEARALLRARLAANIAEALEPDSGRNGHSHNPDYAAIAAFLDGAASPAEREAMAASMADDPAGRSDLVSAMAVLESADLQAEAPPPHLVARAANIFAPPAAPAIHGGGWIKPLLAVSRWRPAARYGFATVMLVALASPVMVQVFSYGPQVPAGNGAGGPVGRSIQPIAQPKDAVKEVPTAADLAKAGNCDPIRNLADAAPLPKDAKPAKPAAKPLVNGSTTAVPLPPAPAAPDPCAKSPASPAAVQEPAKARR
jgi:hypothetical protein